jgi:hypothetical protein
MKAPKFFRVDTDERDSIVILMLCQLSYSHRACGRVKNVEVELHSLGRSAGRSSHGSRQVSGPHQEKLHRARRISCQKDGRRSLEVRVA